MLGASGGVGTGCVILAKLLGAEVIACASSEDKLRRLKEIGADEVIDYTKVDFSKWAVEKYGKPQRRSYEGGVDVVINFTGGDTWVPSLRCIKRGGKLLVCGATAGHDPKEDLRYIWSFEIEIIGSNSFYDDDLKGLMRLIQQGKMQARDRQGAAARAGRRRAAPDPRPRGRRQGGGDAVTARPDEPIRCLRSRIDQDLWRRGRRVAASRNPVLDAVSFTVPQNQFVCLLGASGCGKTTLLRIVAGLTVPDGGDDPGRRHSTCSGPGQDRSLVFQNYGLLPWRTVMGNVEFGLEMRGVPKAKRRAICQTYIDRVGLTGYESTTRTRSPAACSSAPRSRAPSRRIRRSC